METHHKRTASGALVCILVVITWFSPWWLGGKNLAPLDLLNQMMQPWRGTSRHLEVKNHVVADAVDQYLVYRLVAEDSFKKEGWLGWSSLTYGGTAQYANTMALYYDWTMQLHRWFSFWTAWHLGLMGQVILAALGMLLFLRGRAIRVAWSCCGALAYAANSQFIVWIYHRWALGAFCWVPWILWAIDCHRKGRRGFWLFVPVFTAMAMLGGTLQHCAFVVLTVAAAWGEEALKRRKDLRAQIGLLGRYTAWGILGTGMAAMMLLPCAAAFMVSNRLGLHTGTYGNAGMGIYPQGILQPLFNLAAYPFQVFPSILGRCESLDVLKLFKSELFYVAYFGSLPVVIAFLALFRKHTPPLARILIATGLLLPLTPLVRYLYQRLFLLFILGGILAFSHFMETATRETRLRVFKITSWVAGVAIAAWLALSVVFQWKAAAIIALLEKKFLDSASGTSFGYFREWMQARFVKFTGDLCIWSPQQAIPLVLFVAALFGLRLTAHLAPEKRTIGTWLVVLSVVLEVSVFGSRWIAFTDPAEAPLYPVTREVDTLRRTSAVDGRVALLMKETNGHMAITPFVPNTLSAYGIATLQGYDSIVPDGIAMKLTTRDDAAQLGKLGVTHLITYPDNAPGGPGWNRIWESPSMVLFENRRTVSRYIGLRSDAEKDTFFLVGNSNTGIPLAEKNRRENTRLFTVPAGTAWVRIADNQADGWEYRASSSGKSPWQPVLRAPDASMLLPLGNAAESASATVEMRYDPPLRKQGFLISSAALALTLLAGAWISFRPRSGPRLAF